MEPRMPQALRPDRDLRRRMPGNPSRSALDDLYEQAGSRSATPAPPKGLALVEHLHWPSIVFTVPQPLVTDAMNPGFVNRTNDTVVVDRSPNGLQTKLDTLLRTRYRSYLSPGPGAVAPSAADQIRISLVDLTGSKMSRPDFAGWGAAAAMDGASLVKIVALYAVHQLRFDIQTEAVSGNITTKSALVNRMAARWKARGLVGFPKLGQLFDFAESPPAPVRVSFKAALDTTIVKTFKQNDNCAATRLILQVGFAFMASLLWQAGLRHPRRGGLWLSSTYSCCSDVTRLMNPASDFLGSCDAGGRQLQGRARWKNNSMRAPLPLFGHTATALSAATYFTLLAQGRLVDGISSARIENTLRDACSLFWGSGLRGLSGFANTPATKCGLLGALKHDAILVKRGRFTYVAVALTQGVKDAKFFDRLAVDLDALIVSKNP